MLAASQGDMEGFGMPKASPPARNVPKPDNWSGVAQGLQRAKHAIESKDLNAAEHHLREVLEFAPAQAEAWHILAAVLNRQGNKDEAKACLKRMQKLTQPKAEESALPSSQRMAKLLWAQGEQSAALAMVQALLQISPNDDKLITLHQQWSNHAMEQSA